MVRYYYSIGQWEKFKIADFDLTGKEVKADTELLLSGPLIIANQSLISKPD